VTELLCAIDLRDGRAVRLLRGDYGAETVYSDDPVELARAYEAAGAGWIHVVDLEAALTAASMRPVALTGPSRRVRRTCRRRRRRSTSTSRTTRPSAAPTRSRSPTRRRPGCSTPGWPGW
jgi:hypothetical protein